MKKKQKNPVLQSIGNWILIALLCYGGLVVISGCNDSYELQNIAGPTDPGLDHLNFRISDSTNSMTLDSIPIFQPVLFVGTSDLSEITWAKWNFNADSLFAGDTASGTWENIRMKAWKYFSPGWYTVTLTVWYGTNQVQTVTKSLRVYIDYTTVPPLIKTYSTNRLLSNGRWEVKWGLYTKSFYYMNCSMSQKFFVKYETTGPRLKFITISDTADHYFKLIDTVDNYATVRFNFGGNYYSNCYAYIYPLYPEYSNQYLIGANTDTVKCGVKWINGALAEYGNATPGVTGDGIVMFGPSPYAPSSDSVVIYLSKAQVNNSGAGGFWVNDVVGMLNYQFTVQDVIGFPGWWRVAILPSSYIPLNHNNLLKFDYGTKVGNTVTWANITNSFFFVIDHLEANIQNLGDVYKITWTQNGISQTGTYLKNQ